MTLPRVVPLVEFQSGELFERESRGAGTYIQQAEVRGNSILSSIFLESIDPGATLKINYYDTTTGAEVGERFNLAGHDLVTDLVPPLTTLRILTTRIHHNVFAEAIVTGGNIKFSVLATVVSSTASDLDASLKEDGTVAVLSDDKGLPAMGLGDDGEYHFLPLEGGAVKVTGNLTTTPGGVTVPSNTTHVTDATPNTETVLVLTTIKRFRVVNRGRVNVKYAFAAGQSGVNYSSIPPNGFIEEDGIFNATITLYIQAPSASQRLEVVTWT